MLDEGAVNISLEQPLLDLHEFDIPSVAEWDADWSNKQAPQQREYEELNNVHLFNATLCYEDLDDPILINSCTSCHITPRSKDLINIKQCNSLLGGVAAGHLSVKEVGNMPVRAMRISPSGAVSYLRVLLSSVYCVPEATKADLHQVRQGQRVKKSASKASPSDAAAGQLTEYQSQCRLIKGHTDSYNQKLVKKYHYASGHTNLAYLLSVCTSVD
eukprot:3857888-Rhodomonas_salina.1